jgi:hypothetical protein
MHLDAKTIYSGLANYDEADIDSDKGSRFSFIPGKAATRGGYFTNHNDYSWNDIGTYSVAFGKNVKAKGDFSFVVGDSSSVNTGATNSIAMGQRNIVKGGNNVLIGIELVAPVLTLLLSPTTKLKSPLALTFLPNATE